MESFISDKEAATGQKIGEGFDYPRQEAGIKITVITEHPESTSYGNTTFLYSLIEQMKDVGINVKMVVGDNLIRVKD